MTDPSEQSDDMEETVPSSLGAALADLKAALLDLDPAGRTGFEGLVAAALEETTGIPFRLSGSGSQRGVDARSAYENDSVGFEAKRYDDPIPSEKIYAKLAQLSIANADLDLWILAASAPVPAQVAQNASTWGDQHGIGVLILDWAGPRVTPLAAALALAERSVVAFLRQQLSDESADKVQAALSVIRGDHSFAGHERGLTTFLDESITGAGIAARRNAAWLTEIFSNRSEAKVSLRQPLAPLDPPAGVTLRREALSAELAGLMSGAPDDKVVVVLGGEGNGKSWLVAQSWLSLNPRPILLIFSADELTHARSEDAGEILLRKLLQQAVGDASDEAAKRWRRKLRQWRRLPAEQVRLVVLVDGLNQCPEVDWGRTLDALGAQLRAIGGRLVVSTRAAYFRARIGGRLTTPVREIDVPEWTVAERDEILAQHEISGDALNAVVGQSLRNPRLLGIALTLFQARQIEDLNEFSAGRLLFEHIRASERDAPTPQPVDEFVAKLRTHASEMLARLKRGQAGDVKAFDGALEAVSDGRFFVPLPNDRTRYTLADDGLTLALGLAVVDQLRASLHDGGDPTAALEELIEPISALDEAADVVLAAVTVACMDDEYPVEVGSAAICGFVTMQNPGSGFAAFAGLTRERVEVFLHAARRLCLSGANQANLEWVEGALLAAKAEERLWPSIEGAIRAWLLVYSTAVEPYSPGYPADRAAAARATEEKEFEERLAALSPVEQGLLSELTCHHGPVGALAYLAFLLIAGRPIAPFAEVLTRWSFASALSPEHSTALERAFMHLVRFNAADWSAARAALIQAAFILEGTDISRTGKWALVRLLQATGLPEEAVKAEGLAEELWADRPKLKNWRRIEDYCASDPCDPASSRPGNMDQGAKDYAAIDVSKIRVARGSTAEDLFFRSGCPAAARFAPDVAIAKHRAFIAHLIRRSGHALRQGLFELQRMNPLLTYEDACALLRACVGACDKDLSPAEKDDQWISKQYGALAAFPLLSAKEQVEFLLSRPVGEPILIRLVDVMKPLDQEDLEKLLQDAEADKEATEREYRLHRLLIIAGHTDSPVSGIVRVRLGEYLQSPSKHVRREALALLARLGDEEANAKFVQTGWSACNMAEDDPFAAWYGSIVLVEGVGQGLISADEAFARMTPAYYGRAALKLPPEYIQQIAKRIDAALEVAARLQLDSPVPDIEMEVPSDGDEDLVLFSVTERPCERKDPFESFRRLSENDEAFDARQRLAHEAFDAFRNNLNQASAGAILESLRLREFEAIATSEEGRPQAWYELLVKVPRERMGVLHHMGHYLAYVLAACEPEKAVHLFAVLDESPPHVRVVFGLAHVPIRTVALWAAADGSAVDALRFQRLDEADNDHALALEVLAALRNGKHDQLKAYIEKRIATDEPAWIARALMVAGMSTRSDSNSEVLDRYKGASGFLGSACKAARYVYERNIWAEHWYGKMREATTPEDFWRYSELFAKIVDGRYDVWGKDHGESGEQFDLFGPSLKDGIKNRLQKWKQVREKKLFGEEIPLPVFLPGALK